MAEETLSDLKIDPYDIAADYKDGEGLYDRWLDAAGHAAAGVTFSEFARDRRVHSLDPAYSSFKYIFHKWRKGGLPFPVRAILALHEMGIFPASKGAAEKDPRLRLLFGEVEPFDVTNPRFPSTNIISCIAFWRGQISQPMTNATTHIAKIGSEHIDQALIDLLKVILGKKVDSSPQVRIGLNAFHSRFLKVLGSPVGRQSTTDIAVPCQIELALGTLRSPSSSKNERRLARELIQDFILAFFYCEKCRFPKHTRPFGILSSSRNPRIANRRKEIFGEALKKSQLPLGEVRMKIQKRETVYAPEAHFRDIEKEDVDALRKKFQERIYTVIYELPT